MPLPACLQVRCLVDYPGDKLPSVTSGQMERYLLETIQPQVRWMMCSRQPG